MQCTATVVGEKERLSLQYLVYIHLIWIAAITNDTHFWTTWKTFDHFSSFL